MIDATSEKEMIKILINHSDKTDEYILHLLPEYFTDERRVAFNCIKGLRQKGIDIDYTILNDELSKRNIKMPQEFMEYTTSIFKNTLSVIKDCYKKRVLETLLLNTTDALRSMDSEDIIKIIADEIYKLNESYHGSEWKHIKDIAKMRAIEIKDPKSLDKIIRTGFNILDSMIVGLFPGDYIVIGARPSQGKSQIMLKIAGNVSLNHNVGIFSLEMQNFKLVDRYLSELTEIPMYNIKHRTLRQEQHEKIDQCVKEMADMNIMIDDSGGQSIDDLINKMRILKSKNQLDIAFIDHLGFLDNNGEDDKYENAMITKISKKIKCIAKELQIPIVLLSQLNREVEKRSDKRPIMSDIRASGSIEQDADIIMLLYRHDYYYKDEPKDHTMEVIIGKNRDGDTGTVKFLSLFSIMKLEEIEMHGNNIS